MNIASLTFLAVMLTVSIKGFVIAIAVVTGTAVLIAAMLGIAGKFFQVEIDQKEAMIRELLPGNNCGACGYAGCDALAKAISTGEAVPNACPVGRGTHAEIAALMGSSVEEKERMVSFVRCKGTCDKTTVKYHYEGMADCKKLALIPGHGEKVCSYGCMGYGSCVKVCDFDAIHVVDGVALVDKEKCTACGLCIIECPNQLITLVPYRDGHRVGCNSKDKGKEVRLACSTGCIACMLCVKACEFDAVKVENNLATIDYAKCTNCGKCAEKCPQKIIQLQ